MKIIDSASITESPVSHDPEIRKKLFFKNGEIPGLTQFCSVRFQPGQQVEDHVHHDMYESFYCLKGRGRFIVNGQDYDLLPGDTILVEPGDTHAVRNDAEVPLEMLIFSIVE